MSAEENTSDSGIRLCTGAYLPVGSEVEVQLEDIVLFGEVVSCEELGFSAYWVTIAVSERITARAGLGRAIIDARIL